MANFATLLIFEYQSFFTIIACLLVSDTFTGNFVFMEKASVAFVLYKYLLNSEDVDNTYQVIFCCGKFSTCDWLLHDSATRVYF